jgi:hypothetical protein
VSSHSNKVFFPIPLGDLHLKQLAGNCLLIMM